MPIPKYGPIDVLRFVGLNTLSPEEQNVVQRISTQNFEKLSRDIKNVTQVVVHVKCYEKAGARKKYSLHVRCNAPTKTPFESCNADDWDLSRAVHKAFNDIRQQIRHRLRTDVTRP